MPVVLNRNVVRYPRHAVYIGRGSKWGNPFLIGVDGDRAAVIAKYERNLWARHDLLASIDELRGRDLLCFCAPLPCHGDVLLRLANGTWERRRDWWEAMKRSQA